MAVDTSQNSLRARMHQRNRPVSEELNQAKKDLIRALYNKNNPAVDKTFEQLERATTLSREYVAGVLLAVLAAYLVAGALAHYVCSLIAFVYPAYASIKAIRTAEKDDDTQWLTYWTVFAMFSLLDIVFSFIPGYYLWKALFLIYLYLPHTWGAQRIYVSVVDPFISWLEEIAAHYWHG